MEKNMENWKKYELVRRSGSFNMITDIVDAAEAANLTIEEYKDAIKNYSTTAKEIEEKYGIEAYLKN